MLKADSLTLQMTLMLDSHGSESYIIVITLQKADHKLLLSRFVHIADINFLNHNLLRLTHEVISLSLT